MEEKSSSLCRFLSIVLCLFAAVLLGLAACGFWVFLGVLKYDRFTQVVSHVARTEGVSRLLSELVMDAAERELDASDPKARTRLADALALSLQKEGAQPFLYAFADSLYGQVFGGGNDDVSVGAADQLAWLQEAAAAYGRELPGLRDMSNKLEAVTVIPADSVLRLRGLPRAVLKVSIILAITGILGTLLGLLTTRHQQTALASWGFGTAGVGAVLLTCAVIAPSVAESLALGTPLEGYVGGVVSDTVGGLFALGAVIFLLGVGAMAKAGRRSSRPAARARRSRDAT